MASVVDWMLSHRVAGLIPGSLGVKLSLSKLVYVKSLQV